MQSFLFLDIDGPLNTGRNDYLNPERFGHHFDNEAVTNLRRIIEDTDARIVISSSWRHLGLERIVKLWAEWRLPGEVVGVTPGWWGDERTFPSRGSEIQQWLQENASLDCRYAIIDDCMESIPGQESHWMVVDPHCGISANDAQKVSLLLRSTKENRR